MSRTDMDGYSVSFVLEGLLKYRPPVEEMRRALGLSEGIYFRTIKKPDYPNAEELRRIAFHFNLDPVRLYLRFGLIEENGNGGFTAVDSEPAPSKRRPKRVDSAAPPL